MSTKQRIPQVRFISNVQLLTGRILVTLKSGRERSFPYERLTAKQEDTLRSIAGPALKPRREVKPTHETGKPRKGTNYAELVTGRTIFVNGELRVF